MVAGAVMPDMVAVEVLDVQTPGPAVSGATSGFGVNTSVGGDVIVEVPTTRA